MLATADEALDTLLSRASTGALRHPAPTGAALEQIVLAGLRAPDHGKLRPARFIAIHGDAQARFADLCVAALRARDPDATDAEADRMRGKLTAPPLVLALGVHVTPSHKVPEIEQVMSVAASAMNMLNAAHALGFGGKWITGPNAYDPAIARALGVDRLAGFLYLGTPAEPLPPVRSPAIADHLADWHLADWELA
jgi:nitroreductase